MEVVKDCDRLGGKMPLLAIIPAFLRPIVFSSETCNVKHNLNT